MITLRSLACEICLNVRLTGESVAWIVTRGAGVRDPDGAIIKIVKEKD